MKKVKIISIENATHDVVHLKTEKPAGLSFLPGQAVDVSVNKTAWEKEKRPFTFTSLPTDDYLEFHIKTYPEHNGVTEQIGKLNEKDTLSIGEVFGDIQYKGEGVFIAGGAGITPFIAILKDLEKQNKIGNNKLIFANRTSDDIIEPALFNRLLGNNFINILSKEEKSGVAHGYITEEFLKKAGVDFNKYVYLCGPPPMMDAIEKQLKHLKMDEKLIVKEAF